MASAFLKQSFSLYTSKKWTEEELLGIVRHFAIHNPSQFLTAYKLAIKPQQQEPIWAEECRELERRGEHIKAIKHCREVTGWTLQEAKGYCDKLKYEVGR